MLAMQLGVTVLDHAPDARQVVVLVPSSMYPGLHRNVLTVPVTPVAVVTEPKTGDASEVVHGLGVHTAFPTHCPATHVRVPDRV